MTTGTSGRGPERPLFTALASRSYDLPKGGTVARAARRRQRRRLESRQSPRLRPRVLRRSGPTLYLPAGHQPETAESPGLADVDD